MLAMTEGVFVVNSSIKTFIKLTSVSFQISAFEYSSILYKLVLFRKTIFDITLCCVHQVIDVFSHLC